MPFDPEQQTSIYPRHRHVIAPERTPGVSTPPPAPERGTSREKKSKKGLVIGLTSGIAGAALAAGAIMGISAANDVPRTEPTAEASGDLSQPNTSEEQPTSPELTVEQLEIPTGLEVEQVGQTIIERLDSWQNAGTNDPAVRQALRDARLTEGKTTGEFVTAKAEAYGAIFAAALYVDGWEARGDLVQNDQFNRDVNASTLELNLKTSNPDENPDDLEPFQRNIHFVDARELSSEGVPGEDGYTRVIEIDFSESNNADRNRAGEAFAPETATFGTPQGRFTMTLVTVNGVEKIAASSVTTT